jgi:hypothetical protein
LVWDLFCATSSPVLHPFHDVTLYDEEREVFDFVKAHQGLYRTYIHWAWPGPEFVAVMPKQGTLREVFSVTDYEALTLERYQNFFWLIDAWVRSHPNLSLWPFVGSLELEPSVNALRLLDLMSVRYVVEPSASSPLTATLTAAGSPWRLAFQPKSGQYVVFENPDALPRAYVAHNWQVVQTGDEALQAVATPAFDSRLSAVIEDRDNENGARARLPGPDLRPVSITEARITSYAPTEATVETDDPYPGYLILTDTFYPGWKASVDGGPQPTYPANYLFRGVPVSPGHHIVTFEYRPLSFQLGAGITLAALSGTILSFGLGLRRRWNATDLAPGDSPMGRGYIQLRRWIHKIGAVFVVVLACVFPANAATNSAGAPAVLNLAPIAFRPTTPESQFAFEQGGVGQSCAVKGPGYFVAGIHLPDGAAIERITAFVQHAGKDSFAVASLVRRTPTAAEFLAVTPVPTGGQQSETVSVQPPSPVVIDNQTYAYLLHLALTGPGVCFRGVEIRYRDRSTTEATRTPRKDAADAGRREPH